MNGDLLVIDERQWTQLRALAEAAYPEEACGLIVGRRLPGRSVVSRLVPSPNRHVEPRRSFEIDPAVHFALLRQLRDQPAVGGQPPEEVIGHFHSHPDAPPAPSARDLAQAYDPGMVWVIIAVRAGHCDPPGAWRIDSPQTPQAAFSAIDIVVEGTRKTLIDKV